MQWSVVPQLAAMIRDSAIDDSIPGYAKFKTVCLTVHARSLMRAAKGVAAMTHLEKGGIPALAFKGLASMASLYGVPADRTIGDTDVLVTPEDVPPAVSLLEEVGYRPAPGQELEKVERFLDTSPGLAGNKAITLYGPQNSEIDLHWSVGFAGVPPKVMIERSDTTALFGSKIRVPSAIDAMMLTARHSMRENFAIDKIARDLLDLRLWCDKLEREGSLGRVLEAMHRLDRATPVLAMARILAVYDEGSAAAHAVRILTNLASGKVRRTAEELAQLFFAQVTDGPISKDLLYLAHSRPARQIFAAARANWREYRGVMRSMEEQLEGQEVRLPKRIQMLAEAVKSTNLRQFRSIRALARLKYRD